MREFKTTGKKKVKKTFWQKVLIFLSSFSYNSEALSTRGHHERMKARRRKTKFHK